MHHGNKKISWIPDETYKTIKQYIPILCVDVFIEVPEKGFLWIRRKIPPQLNQWAPIGGRIHKFESPENACKRIVKKEVGLDINVEEFLGISEFRDENHYISLNYRATLNNIKQKAIINTNEVCDYIFNYNMPSDTPEQYIGIYQKLRRHVNEHICSK